MPELVDEKTNEEIQKSKKFFLKPVFLIFSILLLLALSVYFFRDPILGLIGLGSGQDSTSVDTTSEDSESPFSGMA